MPVPDGNFWLADRETDMVRRFAPLNRPSDMVFGMFGYNFPPGSRTSRGQEDEPGALGLVLNAVVLWTTRYLDASVERLRALPADQRKHDVLDEDVARLSPLRHANNVLGRYTFRRSRLDGALRPLRDPVAAHPTTRTQRLTTPANGLPHSAPSARNRSSTILRFRWSAVWSGTGELSRWQK